MRWMSERRIANDHEQEKEWHCDVSTIGCRDVVEELETPYDFPGLHGHQESHYRMRHGELSCVESGSWVRSGESRDQQERTWEKDSQHQNHKRKQNGKGRRRNWMNGMTVVENHVVMVDILFSCMLVCIVHNQKWNVLRDPLHHSKDNVVCHCIVWLNEYSHHSWNKNEYLCRDEDMRNGCE